MIESCLRNFTWMALKTLLQTMQLSRLWIVCQKSQERLDGLIFRIDKFYGLQLMSIPSLFTCPSKCHPVGSYLCLLLGKSPLRLKCHPSKTFDSCSGQGQAGSERGPGWSSGHRKKSSSVSSLLAISKVAGLFQRASFFPLDVFHLVDIWGKI